MSRVLFQLGSSNSKKYKQSIKAFINDIEVKWADSKGVYLTTHKDRVFKKTIWYMCEIALEEEDVLKIEVKTYLPNVGMDGDRTFESLYYVDETAPIRSLEMRGVGMKGYPVLKGKLLEIGSISEEDKRKADLEDFLNEGFDEG